MLKKRLLILLILALTLVITTACGSASESGGSGSEGANNASPNSGSSDPEGSDDVYTIKIGHVGSDTQHYTTAAKHFKELVEERSEGRIEVEIYPSSQLGDEREIYEGMQMGTVEMGILSSGPAAGFVPEMALLDLGYLYETREIAQEVLNGPIGEKLNEKMIEAGIRRLGVIDIGFRHIYGNSPITSVNDLQGLTIRTLETPAHIALFEELGANPTPMGFSELYTGLQQGVVDLAENTPDFFYDSGHQEVVSDLSLTSHAYLTIMHLISEQFYQNLPEDLQTIVTDAADETITYHNEVIAEQQAEAFNLLEEDGITIHEIDDLTPFIEVAKKSWPGVAEEIPGGMELLEEILEATGQTLD